MSLGIKSGRAFIAPLRGMVELRRTLGAWRQRARERAQLQRMSDRELWDLRLSRLDARAEYRKPFWRR